MVPVSPVIVLGIVRLCAYVDKSTLTFALNNSLLLISVLEKQHLLCHLKLLCANDIILHMYTSGVLQLICVNPLSGIRVGIHNSFRK